MLYLSEMSRIGWKSLCEYWMNATSAPIESISSSGVKLAARLSLAVENLHGLRARDVLLKEGVYARELRAYEVVAAASVLSEPSGRGEEERDCDERYERQAPVHPEHEADDGEDHHHVAQAFDDARPEELVQRVNVGREARHDAADGVAVEVGELL